MPITTSDPLFSNVSAELNGENPQFLSDVVALINRDPTLVAEVQAADSLYVNFGGSVRVGIQGALLPGVTTYYHATTIAIAPLASYSDAGASYSSGSLIGSSQAVTPAAYFVGELAAGLEEWQSPDSAIFGGSRALSTYSVYDELFSALASQGAGYLNQERVKLALDSAAASSGVPGLADADGYFGPYGSAAQSSDMLRLTVNTLTDDGSRATAIASALWNQPSTGGNLLTTLWNGFSQQGAYNYLNINPSTVTNVTLTEDASGTLTSGTLTTASNIYYFTYPGGNETATVMDASGHPLYYETVSRAPDGEQFVSLTESNGTITASPGNSIFSVFGSNDFIDDANINLDVTGNKNTIVVESPGTQNLFVSGDSNLIVVETSSRWTLPVRAPTARSTPIHRRTGKQAAVRSCFLVDRRSPAARRSRSCSRAATIKSRAAPAMRTSSAMSERTRSVLRAAAAGSRAAAMATTSSPAATAGSARS